MRSDEVGEVGLLTSGLRWRFYYALPPRAIVKFSRILRRAVQVAVLACSVPAMGLHAQSRDSIELSPNYWRIFSLGATTSILLHEAAHIGMAFALGNEPRFGF